MLVVKCFCILGTSLGTRTRPFFYVPSRGDPLPPITLLRVRLEPSVHLRHHRHVTVPELSGDELEWGARARHPDRPMVPRVVQPVAFEPERPEPLAVRLPYCPAIEPAENALPG